MTERGDSIRNLVASTGRSYGSVHSMLLVAWRRSLVGSMIGGIAETQELLDFCTAKNILPETETIAMHDINHAFERMERSDVKYRFVIDMSSLKREIGST